MADKKKHFEFTVRSSDVLKTLIGIIAVGGAIIGIGDRLYTKQKDFVKVETEVRDIHKKVDFMYQAFLEAAKHASLDKMGNN